MRCPIPTFTAAAAIILAAAAACSSGLRGVDPIEATGAPLGFGSPFRWAATAVPLGLDPVVPTPIDNPPNAAKLELGERLFFDPLLSLDSTHSCSSCHRPERGFSDDRPTSLGIGNQPTRRNAPPLINRAWGTSFFRDGRAPRLEAAVLQPVQNPAELGLTLAQLEERLGSDASYRRLFRAAFSEEASLQGPTAEEAAAALATFIRSLKSGDAPFDRYQSGDSTALAQVQKEGRALFFGKARCSNCHIGPTFTDEGFHNTGVAARSGDPGRYRVTSNPADLGAFRTPTLREVARTAPFMHDGSLGSLEDVVDFYDGGGNANPNLDFLVRPIGLADGEKRALVAFLHGLTGTP